MNKEIVIYEENFKVKMSDKTEFTLNKNEMARFEKQIWFWWIFKSENWTLINPSFFLTAEPMKWIKWLSEDQQNLFYERIKEFQNNLWRAPTDNEKNNFFKKIIWKN